MNDEYASVTRAQRSSGLDEIVFAHLQNLPSNQTRITNPTNNTKGQNQLVKPRTQESHHGYSQQQAREGQKHIEHITGYESIEPTTIVASQRTQQRTHYRRNCNHYNADFQRNTCAKDHAREYVATSGISPKEILRGWWQIAKRQICSTHVVSGDPRREDRNDHQDRYDDEADDG